MKNFDDFKSFLEEEDETTKKTLSYFKKEFELYERSFNLLSETVSYLCDLANDEPFDSTAKYAILLIIPKIMQSMQSMRVLSLKGYYYDVSILERSLVESIGLCAYFALNEKEAELWFKGKDIKTSKIKLFDYVFQLLRKDIEDTKDVYGQLCGYVHTSVSAIVSLIAFDKPKPLVSIKFTPEFDKEKVVEIASYPMFISIILKEIFRDELTEKRKEEIMRSSKQYLAEKFGSQCKRVK